MSPIGVAKLFHSDTATISHLKDNSSKTPILDEPANWDNHICLYKIPEHLRQKWWSLAGENPQHGPVFTPFFEEFRDYASFKGIPVTTQHKLNVVVRMPGELYEREGDVALRSVINLGDEQGSVVVNGEKIFLSPGDGLWVPDRCVVELADTLSKQDADVLMLVL